MFNLNNLIIRLLGEKMTVARPKIGVFAGIFKKGKLLVIRRPLDESLPGDWDLPGGGVEVMANEAAFDERVIGEELLREIEEETGLILPPLQRMPAMYPAVMKGGSDWAFAINCGTVDAEPTKGEWKYVSPKELADLANGPIGNRLVSGYGKRMFRLCLRLFASRDNRNPAYRAAAGEMLKKIQEEQ